MAVITKHFKLLIVFVVFFLFFIYFITVILVISNILACIFLAVQFPLFVLLVAVDVISAISDARNDPRITR